MAMSNAPSAGVANIKKEKEIEKELEDENENPKAKEVAPEEDEFERIQRELRQMEQGGETDEHGSTASKELVAVNRYFFVINK
jgi:HPt (histidine-containing phosphotransfer) domain-containing protein